MRYIYSPIQGGPERIVVVYLQHHANVFLMEHTQFEHYRAGRLFRCRGGWMRYSPVLIPIPRPGAWCVVVDLADQDDVNIIASTEVMDTDDAHDVDWRVLMRPTNPHKGFRRKHRLYVSRAIFHLSAANEADIGFPPDRRATPTEE